MTISQKKKEMGRLVKRICPTIRLKFLKRNKHLPQRRITLATCHVVEQVITIRPALFEHTIDGCLHTVLHEVAHISTWQRCRETQHNRNFEKALNWLVDKYGNKRIKAAKKNKSLWLSVYDYDEEK
jgi:predicted SprT family Zn-dependent metalloprotease